MSPAAGIYLDLELLYKQLTETAERVEKVLAQK